MSDRPPVVFAEVPYDWRVPGTYVEVRPDYSRQGLTSYPARTLLVVQMLSGAAAVAGRVYRITRPADAVGLFGAGSVGAAMASAFRQANGTSDLYAIALADNGAGVQQTFTVTITGAATVAGTLALYIAGTRVPVAVATTDTVTQVATAIVAAVAARADLPVTATNSAGVVTLTAKHKGEVGGEIDVRLNYRIDEFTPPGLGVAIAAGTAGSGNPLLATALTAVAAEWYTDLVIPWTDATSLAALTADLARRFTALGRLDAHAWMGWRGAFSGLTTKGGTVNSPFMTAIGAKLAPQPGYVWAAALAGVAAFHLANDPARQLRGLVLPGLMAPAGADQFIDTEQDLLLRAGVSTWTATVDQGVVLSRVITGYRVTTLGTPDTAWLDVTMPKTLSRIRYDWATHISLTYPRAKLADDDALAAEYGRDVVTPRRMLATWAARCRLYGRLAWIEDVEGTLAASYFRRPESDRNRLDGVQRVRVIGQLVVLAAALEFEV